MILSIILYNDSFIPREQGKVDMEDRGYQFGDGIYEAIRVYGGQLFLSDWHMDRLERSARELRLRLPYGRDHLIDNLHRLIEKNQLDDGFIYFQITRGSAPRQHRFPDKSESVLTGKATAAPRAESLHPDGIKAVFAEDIRWLRCDIKTLNLLGNVLAKQKAFESGAEGAILHRGEVVTEGSSSNVFIVKDGRLMTHPADHYILNGITRRFVLKLAKRLSIPVDERLYTTDELFAADEVFFTNTGAEVGPVIQVDDRLVADGKPGPLTKRLMEAFDEEVSRIKSSSVNS